jgi:hypothetical protein
MVEEWDRETKGKSSLSALKKAPSSFDSLEGCGCHDKRSTDGRDASPEALKAMKPARRLKRRKRANRVHDGRGYQDTFRDNASTSAATGADARLQRGEQLTMPT